MFRSNRYLICTIIGLQIRTRSTRECEECIFNICVEAEVQNRQAILVNPKAGSVVDLMTSVSEDRQMGSLKTSRIQGIQAEWLREVQLPRSDPL